MDELIKYSQSKIAKTSLDFTRYLIDEIQWEDRLIGIKGARGVGKTTLILQQLKRTFGTSLQAMYVTLDHFYFTQNRLYEFAEQFYLNGGRVLFLDEVHRYASWSIEIKNLYDLYDDLYIVFTGSSAIQLQKADGDLSRRAAIYTLNELSFREYLELTGEAKFQKFGLAELLSKHVELAPEITKNRFIIPLFKEYLSSGAYPFVIETKGQLYDRILNTINVILENDLPMIENISNQTAYKLRQLMAILANTVPFKINIAALSREIGFSRDMLLKMLTTLDRANLIKRIIPAGAAMGYLTKPHKVYLNNTTLFLALNSGKTNIDGTVREIFFMNQCITKHDVKSSKQGDFLIDEKYIFEVGGAKKGYAQIANINDSFIAADGLELGYGNKIPLWLFGFLY